MKATRHLCGAIIALPATRAWLSPVLDFEGSDARLDLGPGELRSESGVCLWREGGQMEPIAGPCALRQVDGAAGPVVEVMVLRNGLRTVTRRVDAVDLRLVAPLDLVLAREGARRAAFVARRYS